VAPPPAPDVSYGFRFSSNVNTGPDRRAVRVQIPANGNDGTTWSTRATCDGCWPDENGVGYGVAGTDRDAIQIDVERESSGLYSAAFTAHGRFEYGATTTLRVRLR